MHGGETNRNIKQMQKVTSNRAGPNKNFQYSQLSFQRPNWKKTVIRLSGNFIIKGVRKNNINHHLKHMSTFVKTFPGATTDDMESYIVPTLKREINALPTHCGRNDLRKDDPVTIAKKITEIALKSKITVKHVAVSIILARCDSDLMEGKRLQVISLLSSHL